MEPSSDVGFIHKQQKWFGVGQVITEGKCRLGMDGLNAIERRRAYERREYSLTTLLQSLFGRRALGRRADDQVGAYIDRFGPGVLFLGLTIITFCCADAFLTLNLVSSGISNELNPLMRWSMEQSIYLFLSLKIGVTALALFVLLGLKNFYVFDRFKVGHILYAILISYAFLIKYELLLHLA